MTAAFDQARAELSRHLDGLDHDADPATERVAVALAWCEHIPAFLPRLDQQTRETKLLWWRALSEGRREIYRYRASMAIEAYELEGIPHAAE